MPVTISSETMAAIRAHATETPDVEVCGLLLGEGDVISAALPASNVATDPTTNFEIDPALLIATHKRHREGSAAILGNYHSHPNGKSAPSGQDAVGADQIGQYWMIVTPAEVGFWQVISPGRFAEAQLWIEP